MIIAIDGHSACGKSTLAKDIARILAYTYIDSGAMYRAATWYFKKEGILPSDIPLILSVLDNLNINLETDHSPKIYVNKQDVTLGIRATEINDWVSEYAAIPVIRRKMVELQRKMALHTNVVMDGRDIGSVVFPNAEYKFFITADIQTRTLRRLNELKKNGILVSFETVKSNLLKRDLIDSTREDSPLVQCKDAIVIDNSLMSPDEQLQLALSYIQAE
ncbi:MAG: (d)CMP kinase [Saprospiraceae bacterium]|nr:(d)CMP kinase [Saprospiraceae bacterium]